MNRLNKPVLFLIFFFIPLFCFAQDNFEANLAKQFTNYHQQVLQEKLYVHTDRTFYLAGEIIWFKLYLVDAVLHKPLGLSKVAYVEVISTDNKPLLQAKVEMKNGFGDGSFMIPQTFTSERYLLRAYTNLMKNFGADFYFQTPITVVNTFKIPNWHPPKAPDYEVQFFPEGGNLVYGLQSKVAFKAVDQYGQGVNCKGYLIKQSNGTIQQFKSYKFGMGHFYFTPLAGEKYKAIIQFEDGKTLTRELPFIYNHGYVMHVTDADEDHVSVSVATNVPDVYDVYLFAHTSQVPRKVQRKQLRNGKAEFVLNKNLFGEGVSQITVFNEAHLPVCERLYFKYPKQKLEVNVHTDQPKYAIRRKVTLDLISNELNSGGSSNFSVSVFLLDSLQATEQNDLFTYLWLTSDLKGTVESPEYYINNRGADINQAVENLLLTQGWRRFQWENVLQNAKPSFKFLPEYEGHIVSGKVVDKLTATPARSIRSYLSVPGRIFKICTTTSDSSGFVNFVIKKSYGGEEIIVQASDKKYRIEVENPFSEQYSTRLLSPFTLSTNLRGQLLSRSISMQTQNAFLKEQQQRFYLPEEKDTIPFYGTPDKTYLLDEYTRFRTMEEVIREYVSEVRVRKLNNKFHYQVRNDPYKVFFESDPLVLLDGVPVFDTHQLISLDPLKIRKLDVVARKYFLNDVQIDGIASYSTYDGDLAEFELDPDALILDYEGLQLKREFYSPVYETSQQINSRLPDFRNLLFWKPDVKTDEMGKAGISFYTSDLPGKYAVIVQGIDATGKAGNGVTTFAVEK
ncbi:MAG: hypothetical protein ICV66_08285 [Chitinophagaceae bacterium]|nr:hypothetical protein [Chitinophagaceae bacterium]